MIWRRKEDYYKGGKNPFQISVESTRNIKPEISKKYSETRLSLRIQIPEES